MVKSGKPGEVQLKLVWVAPAPVLSRFIGLDNGVLDGTKVLRCMIVDGTVATTDMTADHAQTQMDPGVAGLKTFLATAPGGHHGLDLSDVCA